MVTLNKNDKRLLFVPLGGSGEIGMNMNLYGTEGSWIMVDCGMSFAGVEAPGVDLIFPEPEFIAERAHQLKAIILTHGHEDHIGAVGYLWDELRCPVYATPFTAALVEDKLAELGLLQDVPLHVVEPGQVIDLGPFKVRYVPLAHSIAEGHGLVIETADQCIFHTGDWKLDNRPLIGPPCPSKELSALGEKGVDVVVGDSTNVFNQTESGSESEVRESLMEIIGQIKGRVVMTTFASNVARLQIAGDIAKKYGRHLVLVGRSMHRIYKAARKTGYLKDFPDLVAENEANNLPPHRLMILCTGCQGEARAALSRMAQDDHRFLSLSRGDTVIFSSKIIPGNEITLGHLFNNLIDRKIKVITEKDAFVHVSGHPGRAELEVMYGWLKPRILIPVHGEARHLEKHAAFGRELGIPYTFAPRNGDVLELGSGDKNTKGVIKIGEVPTGRLYLDGDLIVDHDDPGMVGRRRVMIQGLVSVSLLFNKKGALAHSPSLHIVGLPGEESEELQAIFKEAITRALTSLKGGRHIKDNQIEDVIRIAIRRKVRKITGHNPVVITHILRD